MVRAAMGAAAGRPEHRREAADRAACRVDSRATGARGDRTRDRAGRPEPGQARHRTIGETFRGGGGCA
ncbi:hypothetical protein F01_200170 [Burkholderia cenocepacia]|nr:hypothetical protein F01_200170 [Burkholderia cenocepacia]